MSKKHRQKTGQNASELFRLAITHFQSRRLEEAEKLALEAIRLDKKLGDANYLLGIIAGERGRYDSAAHYIRQAIKCDSANPEYWKNLGYALLRDGSLDDALEACNQAIRLDPGLAGAHCNRGRILVALRRPESALEAFEHALRINPQFPDAELGRGISLKKLGRLIDALQAFERAIEFNPGLAEAHLNHGIIYRLLGLPDEAEPCYRRAMELLPHDCAPHSNLIFMLAAGCRMEPHDLLAEQRRWDAIHGRKGRENRLPARTLGSSLQRRLRIGYVSPDFRNDVVSYFFEPLLTAHDRSNFEIFCYAAHHESNSDSKTVQLQNIAEHWRHVGDKNAVEMARLIYADKIDILVDLAGHTWPVILEAFTYRPAPVQATYLGFFAATGLENMDYWITDEILHPQDTVEKTIETIYRLPRCWTCYQPHAGAPEVAHCPNMNEQVVFGSFSQISKLGPELVKSWCRILKKLPESRLLLMDESLGDLKTRDFLVQRFNRSGITSERLLIKPAAPMVEYLATYAQVDIVLDPFPRTGGTTTAEALWMGVPVITLAGRRYVERISASMLTAIGMEDLIAYTEEDYIGTVITLTRNIARRQELRSNLRSRMKNSPLCDPDGLARAMESAYCKMWEQQS